MTQVPLDLGSAWICFDHFWSFFFLNLLFHFFFQLSLPGIAFISPCFFFFLTGPDLVDPSRVAPPQLLNFPVPQFPLLPIATHRIIIWRSTFPSSTSISDLGAALSSDRPSGLWSVLVAKKKPKTLNNGLRSSQEKCLCPSPGVFRASNSKDSRFPYL